MQAKKILNHQDIVQHAVDKMRAARDNTTRAFAVYANALHDLKKKTDIKGFQIPKPNN